MCLPATFVGPGRQITFVGARGDRKRLDYIAIPVGWPPAAGSAGVDLDIDITVAREDHDDKLREACGRGRNLLCVRVKVEVQAECDSKGAHSVPGFAPLH